MNNPDFTSLIRSDHVLGLGAHLAAGIIALVLLTGIARAGNPPATASHAVASATVTPGR